MKNMYHNTESCAAMVYIKDKRDAELFKRFKQQRKEHGSLTVSSSYHSPWLNRFLKFALGLSAKYVLVGFLSWIMLAALGLTLLYVAADCASDHSYWSLYLMDMLFLVTSHVLDGPTASVIRQNGGVCTAITAFGTLIGFFSDIVIIGLFLSRITTPVAKMCVSDTAVVIMRDTEVFLQLRFISADGHMYKDVQVEAFAYVAVKSYEGERYTRIRELAIDGIQDAGWCPRSVNHLIDEDSPLYGVNFRDFYGVVEVHITAFDVQLQTRVMGAVVYTRFDIHVAHTFSDCVSKVTLTGARGLGMNFGQRNAKRNYDKNLESKKRMSQRLVAALAVTKLAGTVRSRRNAALRSLEVEHIADFARVQCFDLDLLSRVEPVNETQTLQLKRELFERRRHVLAAMHTQKNQQQEQQRQLKAMGSTRMHLLPVEVPNATVDTTVPQLRNSRPPSSRRNRGPQKSARSSAADGTIADTAQNQTVGDQDDHADDNSLVVPSKTFNDSVYDFGYRSVSAALTVQHQVSLGAAASWDNDSGSDSEESNFDIFGQEGEHPDSSVLLELKQQFPHRDVTRRVSFSDSHQYDEELPRIRLPGSSVTDRFGRRRSSAVHFLQGSLMLKDRQGGQQMPIIDSSIKETSSTVVATTNSSCGDKQPSNLFGGSSGSARYKVQPIQKFEESDEDYPTAATTFDQKAELSPTLSVVGLDQLPQHAQQHEEADEEAQSVVGDDAV